MQSTERVDMMAGDRCAPYVWRRVRSTAAAGPANLGDHPRANIDEQGYELLRAGRELSSPWQGSFMGSNLGSSYCVLPLAVSLQCVHMPAPMPSLERRVVC